MEENTIVSEITFGEASSGAAIVQGSFLSGDATTARISGPFRNQSSENSREQTIRKGRQRVNALANAMRLSERLAEQGVRYFTLAVANNFIRGRKSQYVVATCLYIVCRFEKTSHMLIDFADILQINVFVLGSTFLKFVKALHINMPLIDPSLYITRFAAMLDFGDDTHKIASDATRLVSRMKRDWIDSGRRPAGICGACLMIAARMNNYRRSMAEIVHVVKVAESTVQQRLADFSQTETANLTVEDFGKLWLEKAHNPPAFEKGKVKKAQRPKKAKSKGKKRRHEDDHEDDSDAEDQEEDEQLEENEDAAVRTLAKMKEITGDDAAFKKPYLVKRAGTNAAQESSSGHAFVPRLNNADAAYEVTDSSQVEAAPGERPAPSDADLALEKEIQDEVAGVLDSSDLQAVESEELARRAAAETLHPQEFDTSLADVDDEEIDSVLLDEDAVKIKTQVWMENNFDYLAAQEQKRLKADTDKRHGIKTHAKKKRRMKPRDSTAPNLPASPAESLSILAGERAFSKKINYEAMERLFEK